MQKMWIVAKDGAGRLSKTWAWKIMLLLPIICVIGAVLYRNATNHLDNIGVVSNSNKIAALYSKKSNANVKFYKLSSDKKSNSKTYILVNDFHGQLVVRQKGNSASDNVKNSIKSATYEVQAFRSTEDAGLSKTQVDKLTRNAKIYFNSSNSGKNDVETYMAVMVVPLILYLFIIMYSSIFATDLGSEKSTKSLDIYLTSLRPNKFFAGKIIGLMLLVIINLFVFILSAIIGFGILNLRDQKVIHSVLSNVSFLSLIFIAMIGILSFIAFSLCAAIFGAKAKDALEASRAAAPVIITAMFFYMSALFFGSNNDLSEIFSFIPTAGIFFIPQAVGQGCLNVNQILLILIVNLFVLLVLYKGIVSSYVKSYKK
ncbi:ABC transporter permease [Oenococcus sp. UCMA 17063]|nr:ABC transporter permease [Oenococcus sp. UCMA 17063]